MTKAEFSRDVGLSKAAITKAVRSRRVILDSSGKIDPENPTNRAFRITVSQRKAFSVGAGATRAAPQADQRPILDPSFPWAFGYIDGAGDFIPVNAYHLPDDLEVFYPRPFVLKMIIDENCEPREFIFPDGSRKPVIVGNADFENGRIFIEGSDGSTVEYELKKEE